MNLEEPSSAQEAVAETLWLGKNPRKGETGLLMRLGCFPHEHNSGVYS